MSTRAKAPKHEYSDNEEWEDLPQDGHPLYSDSPSRRSSATATPSGSVRGSSVGTRKRRPGKTVFVAQATPARKGPPRTPRADAPLIDRQQVEDALKSGATYTVSYAGGILSTVLWLIQKPLAIFLVLYLMAFVLGRMADTLRLVAAPFCFIPGISSSALCHHPSANEGQRPLWADYPRLMAVQTRTFEQLLDQTAGGSGLSLQVKKAEMATNDLVTLVRVSNLKTKDLLADTLVKFVEEARSTARGLQKFSAKVGGSVDSIVAVNDYALLAIEAANTHPSALAILWPFPSAVQTKEVVRQTFFEAMEVQAAQMNRLILEAELNIRNLDRLEQLLTTLHEQVARENHAISAEKDQLLEQLWTILGGNKRHLREKDRHLQILGALGEYRKRALAHVVGALQSLQAMGEDMEELRAKVAAPEIVGDRIPVEVHMKSIRAGLERLSEGRVRARALEEEAVQRILGDE